MNIRRRGMLAAAFFLAVSTAPFALAQGPGGPGGPGGGGPGGPGGRGGRGGFNNRSILQLVQNPAVQEEIKLTDAQKAKVEQIDQASRAKRTTLFAQAGIGNRNGGNNGANGGGNGNANGGNNNGGRGNRGGNGNNGNAANAGNGGNGNGGNGGGGRGNRGGNGGAGGGNGGAGDGNAGAGGNNGGGGGNNGGGGGFGQGGQGGFGQGGFGQGGPGGGNMTDEQRAQRNEVFASMRQLEKDTDAAVVKVLDTKQRVRVAQIKLQSQGLNAFRTPELIASLKIPEVRAQEMAEILDGQNQARRAQFGQMGEVFAQFAGNNNGQRPTREQMQAIRDNPEFQTKMDAVRKKMDASNETLEETTKAQIARLMTKKQRDQYDKMLGEEFDIDKLNTGGRGGPGGRNNNPNNAAAADAEAPKPAAAGATTPATSPAATGTQPARKSLRERRSGTPG